MAERIQRASQNLSFLWSLRSRRANFIANLAVSSAKIPNDSNSRMKCYNPAWSEGRVA